MSLNGGAEIFSILRSVVDTIIKKGGNPFDSIQFALNVATHKMNSYRMGNICIFNT
jgi:hypothetical protein